MKSPVATPEKKVTEIEKNVLIEQPSSEAGQDWLPSPICLICTERVHVLTEVADRCLNTKVKIPEVIAQRVDASSLHGSR